MPYLSCLSAAELAVKLQINYMYVAGKATIVASEATIKERNMHVIVTLSAFMLGNRCARVQLLCLSSEFQEIGLTYFLEFRIAMRRE